MFELLSVKDSQATSVMDDPVFCDDVNSADDAKPVQLYFDFYYKGIEGHIDTETEEAVDPDAVEEDNTDIIEDAPGQLYFSFYEEMSN
jgi:hypothetical protein